MAILLYFSLDLSSPNKELCPFQAFLRIQTGSKINKLMTIAADPASIIPNIRLVSFLELLPLLLLLFESSFLM